MLRESPIVGASSSSTRRSQRDAPVLSRGTPLRPDNVAELHRHPAGVPFACPSPSVAGVGADHGHGTVLGTCIGTAKGQSLQLIKAAVPGVWPGERWDGAERADAAGCHPRELFGRFK